MSQETLIIEADSDLEQEGPEEVNSVVHEHNSPLSESPDSGVDGLADTHLGPQGQGELSVPGDEQVVASDRPRGRFTFFGQVHGFKAFLVLVLCSLIAGGSEKGFGLNEKSARLAISFLVAFILLNYGSMLFRWMIARRHSRGSVPKIAARPMYVAVMIATMVFAQITKVEPALVFGAVLIVDYSLNTESAGNRRPALATIAGAIYAAMLGLAAWVGYSYLTGHHIGSFIRWDEIQAQFISPISVAESFATLALGELLATITIIAIAALPVSLLPFTFLEGSTIWKWSKIAWGLCYALGAALYCIVIVPLPRSWDAIDGSFIWWISLYAVYCALSIGLWSWFKIRKPALVGGAESVTLEGNRTL